MAAAVDYEKFEDLRKQARQLENEIDTKLAAIGKLGVNSTSSNLAPDEIPLIDEEHVFDNMTSEIETLLSKLSDIDYKMYGVPMRDGEMLFTRERHKDLLQNYKYDFQKIKQNYRARKNRNELLGNGRKETGNYKSSAGMSSREMYLKENQHLHNSDLLINDQISIAMETRDHLKTQRQAFKRIQTRFNDISNRFPAVSSLIQRINIRKRRDSVILGSIIGFCTLLMLLYAFH